MKFTHNNGGSSPPNPHPTPLAYPALPRRTNQIDSAAQSSRKKINTASLASD